MRRLFPQPVLCLVDRIDRSPLQALPVEMGFVRGASADRQLEYAAGRSLARKLLSRLGIRGHVLGVGEQDEPIWPLEATGSITHSGLVCGVAVAPRSAVRGVGFDIEYRAPFGMSAWPPVVGETERAWLESQPIHQRTQLATLLLSCKESVAKALYDDTQKWLGFLEVTIQIELESRSFVPRSLTRDLKGGVGRFHWDKHRLATAYTWLR